MECFYKELKVLMKLKALKMVNNGGFPMLLSVKKSFSYGEILMTYSGQNSYDEFDIGNSLEDKLLHTPFT